MSLSANSSTSVSVKAGIGIDFGADAVRLVRVKATGAAHEVESCAVISAAREGIIDAGELAEATGRWLQEHGAQKCPACATLPPMAPTESVLAIPDNVPDAGLKNLVYLQTRTLCTISDDKFLYEYQLQGEKGQGQSVVVEYAREALVNEHYSLLSGHGIGIAQMTSHGLAAVNALLALHEQEASAPKMQLVVNLESEFSTLSALQGGALMFQAWLSFSMGHAAGEGWKQARALKSELGNVLNHWYESASSDQNVTMPERLWLTGSGVLNSDFLGQIRELYPHMDVRVFGMPVSSTMVCEGELPSAYAGIVRPEMTVAFGLALQNCGLARLNISMLPELVSWKQEKRRRFPMLATAAVALGLGLLALYTGIFLNIVNDLNDVTAQTLELESCMALAPQIDKQHEKLVNYQKAMLPVAEISYRTRRYVQALEVWNQALKDGQTASKENWGIYLADEISFERANMEKTPEEADTDDAAADESTVADTAEPQQEPLMMDMYRAPLHQEEIDNFKPNLMKVTDMRLLKGLYLGGITPLGESRYKVVREIQTRLQESGAYVNVDDHVDFLVRSFRERYFTPWLEFLKANKGALKNDYTIFFLKVPFRQEYIRTDAPVADARKKRHGKGGRP